MSEAWCEDRCRSSTKLSYWQDQVVTCVTLTPPNEVVWVKGPASTESTSVPHNSSGPMGTVTGGSPATVVT